MLKQDNIALITKYVSAMQEYIGLIHKSTIFTEQSDLNHNLFVGINTIHRVFEYVFIKTQSIEKAYYYSQKSFYYYLEYMEQIHESGLSQNLNHIDAIFFVYKKTIIEMHDGETEDTSNTMTNIMTLNHQTVVMENSDSQPLFSQLILMVNSFFYWEAQHITCEDRLMLSTLFLKKYLIQLQKIEMAHSMIALIQQKIVDIPIQKYKEWIQEWIKIMEKNRKLKGNPDNMLLRIHTDEDMVMDKYRQGDMKEFVLWLISN